MRNRAHMNLRCCVEKVEYNLVGYITHSLRHIGASITFQKDCLAPLKK